MISDGADPMITVRITGPADPPGTALYGICRRSTAARLAADAGPGAQVTDLGPALALTAVYDREPRRSWLGAGLMRCGVARGGTWLAWFLTGFPPGPVPGSAADAGGRN